MKIEKRTESLKKVRTLNKTPGVLFGKEIEPVSIQIEEKAFKQMLSEKGLTQTFEVKLGTKKHLVYIKDIQRDIVKHNLILNVKLQKVSLDDTIIAHIPLNIIGKEIIEKMGAMVSIPSDALEVEYNVSLGISHIDIDVSKMQVGDYLEVKDLHIGEGLKILADPEQTVVSIIEVHYEEETESAEEVDPADVEVITEKRKQD